MFISTVNQTRGRPDGPRAFPWAKGRWPRWPELNGHTIVAGEETPYGVLATASDSTGAVVKPSAER